MKRLNRYVSALDSSLQQTPGVLKSVRVNVAINVGVCVVNYLVRVLIEVIVGFQRVRMEFRSLCDVLSNLPMQMIFPACINNRSADLACLTIQQTEHNCLAHRSTSANHLLASPSVHVPRFAADESFVGLDG